MSIPREKFDLEKDGLKKSRPKSRIYLGALVLVGLLIISTTGTLSPLNNYNWFTKQNNEVNSIQDDITPFSVSHKEINEEEYLKLGLTPTKPIIIESLDDNFNGLKKKTIHGRFLHITDIHPDEYYKEGSLIEEACHRGKKKKKSQQVASKYGDALLGCDSPTVLMNETFKWIKENLRDKIDFVIWTGDNIRHDADRRIPRTELQIFDMNEKVANEFINLFGSQNSLDPREFDVPVIPSLGNNDVYPHNLFSPGPTLQTRELWNIWQNFIPQEQLHIFERGAYFFSEVIPNQLAVLSINTLYLFKANPLVDNCDNRKQPGYKLFQWLGVVLEELRKRNMKVWLSGHVPPVPKNYDISCFRKYTVWLHEYRDIIIGGVYGHMNLDHFVPVDSEKAYDSIDQASIRSNEFKYNQDDEFDMSLEAQYAAFDFDQSDLEIDGAMAALDAHLMGGAPSGKEDYMETVRKTFYADVKKPKNQGKDSERYSIVNVAASVIPTFNPGLRVWEYNITDIEENYKLVQKPWTQFLAELDERIKIEDSLDAFSFDDDDDYEDFDEEENDISIERKKKKKGKKKKKKKDDSLPPKMPESQPLGPAYTPQTFSPTKFVQYFVNLSSVNEGNEVFNYNVEYKSDEEPYNMKSLLVKDFLKLARKLGKPLKKKSNEKIDGKKKDETSKLDELWSTYLKHVFVSSGYHDD